MDAFAAYLLQTQNLLIMLAASVLITTVQRLVPALAQSRAWVRALPALPIALCLAIVWLPDLVDGGPAEKVLLGLVLGAFSGQANKVLRQTVFGNDKRLQDRSSRL